MNFYPDTFFPFYSRAFFEAVEGQPDYIVLGYLRALSFYWSHNHCQGLENDQEFLRRLCRIEKDKWSKSFDILFGREEFFALIDDKWHQQRMLEEWGKAVNRYKTAQLKTKAATAARWKKK